MNSYKGEKKSINVILATEQSVIIILSIICVYLFGNRWAL